VSHRGGPQERRRRDSTERHPPSSRRYPMVQHRDRSSHGVTPAHRLSVAGLAALSIFFAASAHAAVRGDHCPCQQVPFFAAFTTGQRHIIACTDQRPFFNFIRVVADNTDLIVGTTWQGQLVCGWQPEFSYARLVPVTAAQYK